MTDAVNNLITGEIFRALSAVHPAAWPSIRWEVGESLLLDVVAKLRNSSGEKLYAYNVESAHPETLMGFPLDRIPGRSIAMTCDKHDKKTRSWAKDRVRILDEEVADRLLGATA